MATPKGVAKPGVVNPELEVMGNSAPLVQQVEMVEEPVGAPLRKGTISLNLRLDPAIHKLLRDRSHTQDVSIQNLVDTAIRQFLKVP